MSKKAVKFPSHQKKILHRHSSVIIVPFVEQGLSQKREAVIAIRNPFLGALNTERHTYITNISQC
jgi:hypothetical protein